MQVYLINVDIHLYDETTNTPMMCRALNITEDLGQIEYVFSDKTGTLTQNVMRFRCCSINGMCRGRTIAARDVESKAVFIFLFFLDDALFARVGLQVSTFA